MSRFIYISALFFLISCAGTMVKYSDPIEELYDNFWIDDNTLQIQVEYTSPEKIPYTMRAKSSCLKAKENIDGHLLSLYPAVKDLRYQINIYRTLRHVKSDCRLIVHVYSPELKRKLLK